MNILFPRSPIFPARALFAALIMLAVPAAVRAQQAVLTADSFVSSSETTTNYGPSTTLKVSGTSTALFKFDLVDVLPPGTTAAQVVRARLIVFPDKVTTPGVVDVYQLTSAWTEATVTYLNKPGRGASPLTTQNADRTNSYLNFAVTSLVQGWITNPSSNYGVALRGDGSTYITVDSKENASTSHQAVLQIDVAGPTGATGATGPVGPPGASATNHNATLTGSGTVASPLSVAQTLNLTGSLSASTGITGDNTVQLGSGVFGLDTSGLGEGVHGLAEGDGFGVGVYAEGPLAVYGLGHPTAAEFDGTVLVNGDLEIIGNLSKSSGSFKIDHPLDPEDKYLYHSFVESPDMKNVYDGVVVTDGEGIAVVNLPDWFEALNRDFRYQLTVMGQFAQAIVGSKIVNHAFTIRTDKPNIEVSWQVTGIRQDAWANAHRIPSEVDKSDKEKGHYLHPELFGHAGEPGITEMEHPVPKPVRSRE